MNLWNKLNEYSRAFLGILRSRISDRKIPIFIGWALTYVCNMDCKYCNIKKSSEDELDLIQIKRIINELSPLGCVRIGFTGGEPLLRNDILEILEYANSMNINTSVSTNGSIYNEDVFNEVDHIMLSVDGLHENYNATRNGNDFSNIERIIKSRFHHKIVLNTVIYKGNCSKIEDLVKYARSNRIKIKFQPISDIALLNSELSNMFPGKKEYKMAIKKLIRLKREGMPIDNSIYGLKELLNYPKISTGFCQAGKTFFRIDPKGNLSSCFRQLNDNRISLLKQSLKKSIEKLELPVCDACTIANGIELGKISSLNPLILMDEIRNII